MNHPCHDLAHAPARARATTRGGLVLLGLLGAFALAGPTLVGLDPAAQDLSASLQAPGPGHWLGTDLYGRSVLARLAQACQLSLGLAVLAALSAAVPGVLLGVTAAWWGGRTERTLVLLADAAMALPALLVLLLWATLAPGQHWALYSGLALTLWVEHFRVSRALCRPVLAGDAVQAARLLGLGRLHLWRRHLLPALAPVVGTLVALGTAQAVLALAALGFIGVGLQPPTAELGLMMTEALPHHAEAPWLMAAPVAVLMLVVLSLMWLTHEEPA